MAPTYWEFSICETRMEVGPSAAPMIPMEAASCRLNPNAQASAIAAKIPNCAPAPNRNMIGLESSGPKSIMAPMPMNSRIGITSEASIPTLNSHSIIPGVSPTPSRTWLMTPDNGRFTRMAPNPMGSSRAGS